MLAGIRAGGTTLATFPKANSFQWCVRKSGSGLREEAGFVRRTVAGAAQIRLPPAYTRVTSFCFPFNCVDMNADTGTNAAIVSRCAAYNLGSRHARAQAMSKIEALADRVERLLLRHDELQRTNTLLEQQLGTVTHERDNLRSRLNAARSRIDALLERLPTEPAPGSAVAEPDSTGSTT